MITPATCSQTVGPYFSIGLGYRNCIATCSADAPGEHITVCGQIFDGGGLPVPDGQLEIWQADGEGRLGGINPWGKGPDPEGFTGFARVPFDTAGTFVFHTVRPGPVVGTHGRLQAPHIVVLVFMRGLLRHLHTRLYFAGDERNEADAVLHAIPAERRGSLLAQPGETKAEYIWNIHLQGEQETVFFAY